MAQTATKRPKDGEKGKPEKGTRQPDEETLLEVWELAPPRKPMRFKKDGEVHYLRSVHSLSTDDRARYAELRNRLEQLSEKSENRKLTDGQKRELHQVSDELSKFVLPDMSDEEFDELGAIDKEAAVGFFIAAFASTTTALGEAIGTALPMMPELEGLEELEAAAAEAEETEEAEEETSGKLIARLQATYGGDPGAWTKLPEPQLHAYAVMRPRLEAERLLDLRELMLSVTGRGLDDSSARAWLARMQERAAGDERRVARRRSAGEAAATLGRVVSYRSGAKQSDHKPDRDDDAQKRGANQKR